MSAKRTAIMRADAARKAKLASSALGGDCLEPNPLPTFTPKSIIDAVALVRNLAQLPNESLWIR
jgi:hypothetical protein